MEFCVDRINGRILEARPDGSQWGSGESYSRFVEVEEPVRWEDYRLILIKCPEITEQDGYRYKRGLIAAAWLEENEDPEPELDEQEFTAIATPAVELELP